MLTVVSSYPFQPATGSCRRLLVFLALGAVTALGCASPPPLDVSGARGALGRAIRRVRPAYPEKARYLERLVADAEVATAGELAAPWWAATPGRGSAAWLRAVVAARQVSWAVAAEQSSAAARYRAAYPEVAAEVGRARSEMRETGMGRREAAALERAVVALATADRLAGAGDHARASEKLETARKFAGVVHGGWQALHARFADPTLRAQWRHWVELTLEESRISGDTAIVVDKLHRRLLLFHSGLKMAEFPAELGANGLRRKEHAGDRATPEGMYRVVRLKYGPQTKYYKALLINYPNEEDRARYAQGKARGTIPARAGIGSLIEIHGHGGEGQDWTDGCVALANEHMDVVFARARIGTPVTIVGTYER